MLQKLNERIQGFVAWIIIILVTITFTLFGIDYYLQSRQESNAAVDVNGQPISKQAYELQYRRVRQMRDPSLMTAALDNQLKQQVLDDMIMNMVSMEAARANGFEVTAPQADAAILGIPQFQQDGQFSADKYQQALNGAFFTPESFQREVRQGMLLNQQRFAFIGTSFALSREINQFVQLYMQTRDYDYLEIPALRFIQKELVSSDDVQKYYQQHQKEFLSPEMVSVDYVKISMADIKNAIHISDDEVKRYYEDNQNNYYTPAQWKVAHILLAVPADVSPDDKKRIKQHAEEVAKTIQQDPSQFEANVKAVSDDKISALKGGLLPWITAGQSQYDKTLIKLSTAGQVSDPVKTEHGYEIFKLVAYRPSKIKPLSDVAKEVKEQLVADQSQAEYGQMLEKLSDLSYQTPDSLTPVADALKLDIHESPTFSRQGEGDELTKNKQVISAAFSHDVLVLGNNSEPIQLDNESVIVLRVNKHLPVKEKSLAEVTPLIQEKIALEKAKKEALNLGKTLLTANINPLHQGQLLEQHQLKWQSITKVSRDTDKTPENINEIAFGLARVGAEVGRSLNNGNYVIVHLKKINDGQLKSLDKEQIASITQQIEANYGMMDYDLYMSDLMSKANVVRH